MTLNDADRSAMDDARESLIRTSLNWHRLPGIGLDVEATAACRAIELAFRNLGVDVTPLSMLADVPDLATAVARIGRSHEVFGRTIDLQPDWWRSNGEILVVDHRTLGPCTLVPQGSRWDAIVPKSGSEARSLKVDQAFALECSPVAYELIRLVPTGDSSLYRLLKTATRGRWGEIWSRISAGVVSAILGLLIPIVTAIMINQVIPDGEASGVVGIGLALLVAAGATSILGLLGGLSTLRFDNTVAYRTETMVLARVIDRFRRVKNEHSDGEIIQRITSVNSAMGTITPATDKVVVEAIRGFAHLLLLFYYSWILAAVAFAALVIALTAIFIESFLQNRFVAGSQAAAGRSESLSIKMLEGLDSIRDRDIAEPLLLRWAAQRGELSNLGYLSSTVSNIRTLTLTLLGGTVSLLVYFLATGHYAGDLNTGNFVAATMAISVVMASLGKTAGVVAAIATVAPVFNRLRPLLKTTTSEHVSTDSPTNSKYRFEFEDVSISDTSWGRTDLANCSFRIEPGSLTVIAAERVASSRVLLEVIVGLRPPQKGRVLLDGRSLDSIDSGALRRLGAILITTPRVLPVTLRKNLDLERKFEDAQLDEAMERTGLKAIVDKLPLGLNSILDARNISAILATRLAATRSLLHPFGFVAAIDQPILQNTKWGRDFMDEITRGECTRVIATSAPRFLARADRILVLDDEGMLVADGDLQSLRDGNADLPPSILEAIR
ncbi:MAG: hypothetical protein CMJ23_05925 [Phycisphaerae bacterium]|nr:hypothetical protein [Phycisphaerae bacterium]